MLETSAGQDGSDQEREAPRRKWGDRALILSAVFPAPLLMLVMVPTVFMSVHVRLVD